MCPAVLAPSSSSVRPTMIESSTERRKIDWRAARGCGHGAAMGPLPAGLAQLVEQLPCKHQVAGSTPAAGTIRPGAPHQGVSAS